jgi:hypothetical protein
MKLSHNFAFFPGQKLVDLKTGEPFGTISEMGWDADGPFYRIKERSDMQTFEATRIEEFFATFRARKAEAHA